MGVLSVGEGPLPKMRGMNTLKITKAIALGAVLTAGWGSAIGAGVDGGPLLATCEAALRKPAVATLQKDSVQSGYCMGFLDSAFGALVAEAAESRRPNTGVCPQSDSGDPLTLVKVVVKYLKANPQTHTQPAEMPVRAALRQAFPCR